MKVSKSPWLLHYDGSSCNGCDIEVLACLTPVYDVERFGVINTGNPKHADIFLITGGINEQNKPVVQQLYSQMPSPKVVVAVGICACNGGIFKECYNIIGGVDTIIPVDIYVPGCAARPEAIIDGVVKAVALLDKKREERAARKKEEKIQAKQVPIRRRITDRKIRKEERNDRRRNHAGGTGKSGYGGPEAEAQGLPDRPDLCGESGR